METKFFKESDSWGDDCRGLSFHITRKQKRKKNKKLKRKHDEIAVEEDCAETGKFVRAPKFYGLEESSPEEESPVKSQTRKERKRKNGHKTDDDDKIPSKRIKHVHNKEATQVDLATKSPSTLEDKLRESLKGSRFRFLNEQLYTSTSVDAVKLFDEDESAFTAYHEGYRHQVSQWPMNPLKRIIKQINKM